MATVLHYVMDDEALASLRPLERIEHGAWWRQNGVMQGEVEG